MIRVNMFSQADSVKGRGVDSAYQELISLIRTRLVDDFYMTINKYGQGDLARYRATNPTYFVNSFSPARGRKIDYVHFLPETLEGSIKLPQPTKKAFYNYVINFYKHMDQIVIVSPMFIDKLVAHGLDRSKVKYIPNFVPREEFYTKSTVEKDALRNQLGISLDKFVIFGDGQAQEREGVGDFAKLAEASPDIQFIWADGFSFGKIADGYNHYRNLIENPPKNLIFTGIVKREELVNHLSIADLFLLLSFNELFLMSALEAFSCGTPVLLRNLDLYRAIIDGYYMYGDDFTTLSEQTRTIKTNPDLLKKYASLSLRASEKYSEEHLAEIWWNFYLEQYELGVKLGQIHL